MSEPVTSVDGSGVQAWLERVRGEYWEGLGDDQETGRAGALHVLFSLGTRLFAVEAGRCKGVVRCPRVTGLPMVPSHILGVVGIRGEVFSVTDPVRLLGLRLERGPGPGFLLVVSGEEMKTALWVDRVVDVTPIADEDIKRVELPWPGAPPDLILGRVEGVEPVVVLDGARIVVASAVAVETSEEGFVIRKGNG